MTRGVPVLPSQRARVIELIKAERGRNEIAAEVGISTAAVSRIAQAEGLSFDRTQTAAATEARVIDLRARRTAIIARLYGRSETVLDRLEAETYTYTVTIPGKGSEKIEDTAPPASDERALSGSISTYLMSAARLEDRDPDGSLAKTHSLLDALVTGFVSRAAEYEGPDDGA